MGNLWSRKNQQPRVTMSALNWTSSFFLNSSLLRVQVEDLRRCQFDTVGVAAVDDHVVVGVHHGRAVGQRPPHPIQMLPFVEVGIELETVLVQLAIRHHPTAHDSLQGCPVVDSRMAFQGQTEPVMR